MSLICHSLGRFRYRSALVSFVSMHSIEHRSKAWQQPGNLSSFLSGLVWAVQLLIFRTCVDAQEGRPPTQDGDAEPGRHIPSF